MALLQQRRIGPVLLSLVFSLVLQAPGLSASLPFGRAVTCLGATEACSAELAEGLQSVVKFYLQTLDVGTAAALVVSLKGRQPGEAR
jgi:hypothetical protein